MIERYNFIERLGHWLTGFWYLYGLATGLAFYSPHLFWMAVALGGAPTSRFWHPIVGLLFSVGVLWMHSIWRRDLGITDIDRAWLAKTRDYAANRDSLVPPQDRFNGGQKIFYWAMFYGTFLLLLSGIVMWFPEYVSGALGWLRPIVVVIHVAAALITIGAFIVHLYMGVMLVPGSLTAMVQGQVTRDWARHHHRLWYARISGQSARE
jgi:formate dehydrogenase subunit gamma